MPDNLSVSISADTSKLRAELKLAQQELKNLEAAEKAAVKAGDVAEVNKATAAWETQARVVRTLSTEYNKLSKSTQQTDSSLKEFIHSGRGLGRVVGEFSNLSRGAESLTGILGVLTGGFVGGLAGVAVARAFEFLLGKLDEVQKRIETIQTQAGNLGVKPIAAQAIGEAAGAEGLKPEEAIAATQKMSDKIDEARNKIGQLGSAGVTVFQGSLVDGMEKAGNSVQAGVNGIISVMKGGKQPVLDLSKGLDGLNVVMSRFPGTEEGKLQAIIERYKTFLAVMKQLDTQQQNILSKGELGLPGTKGLEIAEAEVKRLTQSLAELKDAPRAVTPPVEDMAKKLKQAANESKNAWDDVFSTMDKNAEGQRLLWTQAEADIGHFVTGVLKAVPVQVAAVVTEIQAAWGSLTQFFSDWATTIGGVFDGIWSSIKSSGEAAANWIIDKFNAVVSAIKSVGSALGAGALSNPEAAIAPMASGGMVRGPGGDTSDSIMARLSNGEFVMRAAAVRHWGADMMQALNAAGSNVLPRSTRRRGFAAGGMVTATTSDGVTVNLHFPGGNFSLHGDKAIVAGLTREARRAGMLSANRLPAFA